MTDGSAARQTGQPVDGAGRFAIDPTANVRELVEAAMQRQDDLRAATERLYQATLEGINRVMGTELEAIKREFALIESRRQEQKTDTKVAVDAALSAAKDAVKEQAAASEKAILKSETSAGEQSKQNAVTFSAQMANVTSMLADVKERVGKLESIKQGGEEVRTRQRNDIGMMIGVAGFVSALLGAWIGFIHGAFK